MALLTQDDLDALEVCKDRGTGPGQIMSLFLAAHVHSKIIPSHPATWNDFVDEAASIVYGKPTHLDVSVVRLPDRKWTYAFPEPFGGSAHVSAVRDSPVEECARNILDHIRDKG